MIPHDLHPARHVEQRALFLPGRQRDGVPAADIRTAQGTDGLWYAAWGYFYGNGGRASPITHSDGFASEREAIASRAQLILEAVRHIQTMPAHNYADGDRDWCRKIEAWALELVAPQQMGLDL